MKLITNTGHLLTLQFRIPKFPWPFPWVTNTRWRSRQKSTCQDTTNSSGPKAEPSSTVTNPCATCRTLHQHTRKNDQFTPIGLIFIIHKVSELTTGSFPQPVNMTHGQPPKAPQSIQPSSSPVKTFFLKGKESLWSICCATSGKVFGLSQYKHQQLRFTHLR